MTVKLKIIQLNHLDFYQPNQGVDYIISHIQVFKLVNKVEWDFSSFGSMQPMAMSALGIDLMPGAACGFDSSNAVQP